jgi:hypothetical protein
MRLPLLYDGGASQAAPWIVGVALAATLASGTYFQPPAWLVSFVNDIKFGMIYVFTASKLFLYVISPN